MPVPQMAGKDPSPERHRFLGPRVPPNLFGIVLGIAGLAGAWYAAGPLLGTPQAIPGALSILDAALWLVLAGAYLLQGPRTIMADLRDPVLSPFVPASAITAMIRSAALAQHAFTAGRVLVIVFLAVTIGLGGWLTGQWMTGGIDPDSVHTGYFLPTAAGGLIGADAAAQVHLNPDTGREPPVIVSWGGRAVALDPALEPTDGRPASGFPPSSSSRFHRPACRPFGIQPHSGRPGH